MLSKATRNSFDAPKRSKSNKKPYIESHRGCNKEEPENTLAAFKRAIDYHCDSIELDIWLSKDYIPMVIHCTEEGDINQTTTGNGKIWNFTKDELQLFFAGKDEPIPTLESILRLCKDAIFINIEIKDKNYEQCLGKVLNLISEFEMRNQIAISSFKHEYWEEVSKLKAEVEFGFLYETDQCDYLFDKPFSTLNIWYQNVKPELVRRAHESNMGVHVWFKMDDIETEEIYEFLFVCEVDVICSNFPKKVLEIRDKKFSFDNIEEKMILN
jgi:glycerophosphoryl diester phosphodiesterase